MRRALITGTVASAMMWVAVPATAEEQAVTPESQASVSGESSSSAPVGKADAQLPAQIVVDNIPVPPEGKGQVIFFRKGGLFGAAISCAVHENGAKLTSLPPGKYYVHVAEPGIHQYSVKSEATDTLRMEIEPGETYYSQCTISMGVMAGRPNLSPSDKSVFEKLGAKLKPAVNKIKTADNR